MESFPGVFSIKFEIHKLCIEITILYERIVEQNKRYRKDFEDDIESIKKATSTLNTEYNKVF